MRRPSLAAAAAALGTLAVAAAVVAAALPGTSAHAEAGLSGLRATSPSATTTSTTPPTSAPAAPTVREGVYAVGDSVMLGAAPALEARGITVNAQESRQFGYAVGAVAAQVDKGRLPRTLVLHLGTNGTIEPRDCRAVLDTAGPDRTVLVVTVRVPRSWEKADNRVLRECVASSPNAVLVDWRAYSADKKSWFYADRIHLTATGQKAYARMIADAVAAHAG